MKEYILMITGAILISAAASVLTPGGKLGSFIRGMARLFVFSVVVMPLFAIGGKEFSFGSMGDVPIDSVFLEACAEKLSLQSEEETKEYLSEQYALSAEVEIGRGTEDGFPVRKIVIKLKDEGIFGEKEHIDIAEKIRADLSEKYACRAEVVWIG